MFYVKSLKQKLTSHLFNSAKQRRRCRHNPFSIFSPDPKRDTFSDKILLLGSPADSIKLFLYVKFTICCNLFLEGLKYFILLL